MGAMTFHLCVYLVQHKINTIAGVSDEGFQNESLLNSQILLWKARFDKKRHLTKMNDETSETMFPHYV